MDDLRFGRAIRVVRIRRGWRQIDLAEAAKVSRPTITRIERGQIGALSLDMIRAVAGALEMRAPLAPSWRGGELDRVIAARHSQLHEAVARALTVRLPSWQMYPEVSFNVYGERGVIDLVLWHQARRAMLIVELKTEIVDVNELLGTMDRRRRLAPRIGRERGLEPDTVSAWIIVAASRTTDRRIAAHAAMLRAAYPLDGRAMRAWLRQPVGSVAGLSTWTVEGRGRALAPTCRVRVKGHASTRQTPSERNVQ